MVELDTEEEKVRPKFSCNIFQEAQAESQGRQNEDTLLVKEGDKIIMAVIADGGSALSGFTTINGVERFNGLFVSRAIVDYLDREFDKSISAPELLLGANIYVRELLLQKGVDPENASALELPTASGVSIVLIDKINQTLEVAQVGDTAVLINGRDGTNLAIEFGVPYFDNLAFLKAAQIAAEKGISYKEALQDEEVGQLFIKSRLFENADDDCGSGAINGKKGISKYLKSTIIPLDQIRRIAILSDGMFIPAEDFTEKPEWNKTMQIIEDVGLEGLYNVVSQLKTEDPDFEKYPRAKQHDDATGILISVD